MKKITLLFLCGIFSCTFSFAQAPAFGRQFDGISDYVQIPAIPAYNIGTGDFTIEMIIRMNTNQLYPASFLFYSSSNSVHLDIIYNNNSSPYGPNNSLTVRLENSNFGFFNLNLNDQLCHHIAVTRAGTTLTLYKDGFAIQSMVNSPLSNITVPSSIFLGGYTSPFSMSFSGFMQEVRFWNVARTQSQIQTYMNLIYPSFSDLIGYWWLDDWPSTSTVVEDLTPNHNDGTSFGTVRQSGCSSCTLPSNIITTPGATTACNSIPLVAEAGNTSYKWYNYNFGSPTAIANSNVATYTATASGTYFCMVTNSCGTVMTNTITVTILTGPPATITAAGPTVFCSPGSVTLNANTGNGLSYQWMLNSSIISGATNPFYLATASGNYTCVIMNQCGSATSNIITVTALMSAPAAIINPGGPTTFCSPGSVTLTANSTPGNSYQWRLNGGNISGATSVSYAATAAGSYDCVVTNACGSATSNIIIVSSSGLCGMGLQFTSSANTRVTINDNPSYSIGTGDFTIEAWIKASSSQSSNVPIIASKRGVTSNGFLFFLSAGRLNLQMAGINFGSTSNNLRDNSCHHVAVTRAANTVKFYVDGVLVTTLPVGVYNINSTHAIWLGRDEPASAPFNGLIHEFRFWNLERTQPQIFAAKDSFLTGSETGLIGYWKMNAGAGQTVQDYSPLANSGVLGASSSPESIDPTYVPACLSNPCTPPTATITAAGPTVFCAPGSVTLNANIGSGLTYQWRLNNGNIPGATASSYAVTSSGNYDCIVSNSCLSTASNAITVTVNPAPPATITASGPTTFCSPGSVTLNANTGTGLSYQWRLNTAPIAGATSASYSATATGNYDCLVSNSCGTTTSNAITINVNTPPVATATAAGPTTFCYGGNVVLNASPTGSGYAYQWRNNGVNINGATASSYTANAQGNYDVVISNPCVATSNIITVTLINSPTVITLQPNAAAGMDVFLSSLPSQINSNFGTHPDIDAMAWTHSGIPGVNRGLIRFDLSAIPVNTAVLQATLTLYNNPTSSNNGGAHSSLSGSNASWLQKVTSSWDESTVTWNTQPSTTATNQVVLAQSTSANQDYTLDVTTLVQDMVNNPASNYGFMLRLQVESYYRALIFASSDCADPTKWPKLVITIPPASVTAAITAAGPVSFCSPGSVTLNANTGSGLSYQWRLSSAPIPGATLSSYVAAAGGNYDCIVSDNCSSATSNTIAVTVGASPTASIIAAGPISFCAPGSVTLNANIGSGLSYQWRLNSASINGATLSSYIAATGGSYDCIVSNSCGSATSNEITVTVNSPPAASISAGGPTTFCAPGSVSLNANTGNGLSYQWRLNSAPINGATLSSYVAVAGGSYDCIVSNTCGSSTSNTITVTINTSPTASIIATGPTTFCSPGFVTLNANTGSGLSYQWRLNGGNIAGALSSSYNATATGNYDCVVSNTCGNTTSNVISVTVNSAPTAIITPAGPTTVCSPGSVTLNATAGFSYQWRLNGGNISGATSASYNAGLAGNYDCVVTNSCGSITTNIITFTVIVAPATPGSITGQTSGACSAGLIYSISSVPGATSYLWTAPAGATINSGQGTTSINVSFPASFGSGSVLVAATNSCGTSGQSSLAAAGVPLQPGNISGPASVCHNQNNVDYTIAAVTGATSYTWTVPPGAQIKTGQGTIHIRVRFGNSAGNITVRANNSCGQSPVRTLAIAMPCREDFTDSDFDVMLYPNPATNEITVYDEPFTIERIEIFNAVGQSVLNQQPQANSMKVTVDISALPAGVYFVNVTSKDYKKILKFIKQE